MGSIRKRPADRSSTSTESKRKETKSKKKKTKIKFAKDSTSDHHQGPSSSLETTATKEGQIMAQVLSTFNRLEQSRFEAFRRGTFCGDSIGNYVAHCLVHQQRLRHYDGIRFSVANLRRLAELQQPKNKPEGVKSTNKGTLQKSTSNRPSISTQKRLQLSELCASPEQAEEICIVVSTLAKAYAQRLVTAARRAASDGTPILPEHIMAAYHERRRLGLDPGFFFFRQDDMTTTSNAARLSAMRMSNGQDYHNIRRLATLHAQEEYEKTMEEIQKNEKEKEEAEERERLEKEERERAEKEEAADNDVKMEETEISVDETPKEETEKADDSGKDNENENKTNINDENIDNDGDTNNDDNNNDDKNDKKNDNKDDDDDDDDDEYDDMDMDWMDDQPAC